MKDETSYLLDYILLLRAHWKHLLIPAFCIAHGKQELRHQTEIVSFGCDALFANGERKRNADYYPWIGLRLDANCEESADAFSQAGRMCICRSEDTRPSSKWLDHKAASSRNEMPSAMPTIALCMAGAIRPLATRDQSHRKEDSA